MTKNKFMTKNKKGFTLVELLIVIAVIAILAAIAFIAIDPATRFAEARNSQRWSDVSSILEAVQQYTVDNSGTLPASAGTYVIGTGTDTTCTDAAATAVHDLASDLEPTYFDTLPQDPSTGTAAHTGYYMAIDSDNHVTIGACDPETIRGQDVTIKVTR